MQYVQLASVFSGRQSRGPVFMEGSLIFLHDEQVVNLEESLVVDSLGCGTFKILGVLGSIPTVPTKTSTNETT